MTDEKPNFNYLYSRNFCVLFLRIFTKSGLLFELLITNLKVFLHLKISIFIPTFRRKVVLAPGSGHVF